MVAGLIVHTCHAPGCSTPVAPKLFMCRRHWRMLPAELRALVWKHYRPGQEVDKKPSADYLEVTQRAKAFIARFESLRPKTQRELFT